MEFWCRLHHLPHLHHQHVPIPPKVPGRRDAVFAPLLDAPAHQEAIIAENHRLRLIVIEDDFVALGEVVPDEIAGHAEDRPFGAGHRCAASPEARRGRPRDGVSISIHDRGGR